jgi:hypothetical protein
VPSVVAEYCNSGDYHKAAMELSKYCNAGGKPLPVLVRRRAAEARLLEIYTMSRGAPRVQYNRVYHLLPQEASIDDAVRVAKEAYEARETVGYSYDDAGVGDLDVRSVILHGKHPESITEWYQEHYPGVQVTNDPIPPKEPHKPDKPNTPALIGLHGSADGSWGNPILPEAQEQVKRARIEAYKSLSNESADTVDVLRNINADIFIMVRLFSKVDSESATASEFVHKVGADARSWYQKGVRYFEVHNEPNLKVEGWLSAWSDGQAFATWWLNVVRALEEDMPEAKWGYPGLSPGHNIEGVRYDPMRFYEESWQARKEADFICSHCYFTNHDAMSSMDGGNWYKRYDTKGKPLMITEFSNPGDEPKAIKGQQYLEYYKQLEGVHSAYSFVVSASSSFDNETWVGSPIANIIGGRNEGNA